MNALTRRLKETSLALLPIMVIMIFSHFVISPFTGVQLWRLGIGSVMLLIGLALFLIGVDLAIAPVGQLTGGAIVKSNSLWIVFGSGVLLGFVVSIAEPGILVLGQHVGSASMQALSAMLFVVVVSIGLAFMVGLGFLRIIYRWNLRIFFLILYSGILILALFSNSDYISIAFDASGATTGVLTVPFLLALSYGIASMRSGGEASEKDSFGIIAVASTGPIYAILLLSIFAPNISFPGLAEPISDSGTLLEPFFNVAPGILLESLLVLAPLLVIFLIMHFANFKLPKHSFVRILKGYIYAFIGLFLFLTAVDGSFMALSYKLGQNIAEKNMPWLIYVLSFLIGASSIVAEPGVIILTEQIKTITSGYVKPKAVYVALFFGVGIALLLTAVRLPLLNFQVWYFILPGFVVAIALSFFTPELFVAIGFDSGGLATGPIIVSFALAFVQGVSSQYSETPTLKEGFGMISLVAVFPIITLEILGLIFKMKSRKGEKRRVKQPK